MIDLLKGPGRIGQRWTRRPADDAVRHRDDGGESSGPREDAGRPAVATREAPLENRTALCLAPQLPPRGHPLGATRRELPGHGAARLCPDLAPGIYEIASRNRRAGARTRHPASANA